MNRMSGVTSRDLRAAFRVLVSCLRGILEAAGDAASRHHPRFAKCFERYGRSRQSENLHHASAAGVAVTGHPDGSGGIDREVQLCAHAGAADLDGLSGRARTCARTCVVAGIVGVRCAGGGDVLIEIGARGVIEIPDRACPVDIEITGVGGWVCSYARRVENSRGSSCR